MERAELKQSSASTQPKSCVGEYSAHQWHPKYMSNKQPNNPLHGITLERVVAELVEHYGWEILAERININCFKNDPSVKSSLKFLRKTQWARDKVESLYISTFNTKSLWKKSN